MNAKRERARIDKDYHRLSERKERLRDTQRKRERECVKVPITSPNSASLHHR